MTNPLVRCSHATDLVPCRKQEKGFLFSPPSSRASTLYLRISLQNGEFNSTFLHHQTWHNRAMPSPPGNVEESRANARPLLTAERIWRDRYEMLESHGYRLRPRFRPGWEPSWLNTKKPLRHHEDYLTHFVSVRLYDAPFSTQENCRIVSE